ncbi:MAG: DUF3169 family protein [Roseburia sp.]
MEQEIKKQIRQDNKKAGARFAIILGISLVVGVFVGMVVCLLKYSFAEMTAEGIQNLLIVSSGYCSLTLNVILILIAMCLYKHARKMYANWEEDDEEQMRQIEGELSIALLFSSVDMIQGYFFFAVGASGMAVLGDNYTAGILGMNLVALILTIVLTMASQKVIVDFEREMNPEKRGSVYDMDFAKKWESSCDEAEKMAIYKAGYKSYKATHMCCLVLWVFCVLAGFIWNIGILPVAIVTIIWMVSVVSYCINCMKESK